MVERRWWSARDRFKNAALSGSSTTIISFLFVNGEQNLALIDDLQSKRMRPSQSLLLNDSLIRVD
jgi:hypothetical protein